MTRTILSQIHAKLAPQTYICGNRIEPPGWRVDTSQKVVGATLVSTLARFSTEAKNVECDDVSDENLAPQTFVATDATTELARVYLTNNLFTSLRCRAGSMSMVEGGGATGPRIVKNTVLLRKV